MIVLDASAAVSALLNDGPARRLLDEEPVHVPHVDDVEVLSALRRHAMATRRSAKELHRVLDAWRNIGVTRYVAAPLLDRAWGLRASVSAYDAMYVALAENLECPLVTADAQSAGANGPRCAVTVVPS